MKWLSTLMLCVVTAAHADDKIEVCAKDDVGKTYQIEAWSTTGAEMNRKSGTLRWNQFSNYVVIFWARDRATAIDIGGIVRPSAIPLQGTDQQGRRWQVALSSGVCY